MLAFSNPLGQSFSAKLDGSDAPYTGDPGQTSVSMKKDSDKVFTETDKRDGKVISTEKFTVSGDGKSLKLAWQDMLHHSSGSFAMVKQ